MPAVEQGLQSNWTRSSGELYLARAMPDFDRKFLFVTGKGGVGKTTISVALARSLARRGQRVLLALSDQGIAPGLLRLKQMESSAVLNVEHNLSAVLIEPEAALRQYGSMALHSGAAYKALFENRYAKSFFSAIPGLFQWAVLGKAWFHSEERDQEGRSRFDAVVFDAPATGHGLEMLRVPKVITEVAPAGILRRDAEAALLKFKDPSRAGVVVVSLPEELAVSESLELLVELQQLELPVVSLVLNGVHPSIFDASDGEALRLATAHTNDAATRRLLNTARRRLVREQSQAQQAQRLEAAVALPVVTLPWTSESAIGESSATLVDSFSAACEASRPA